MRFERGVRRGGGLSLDEMEKLRTWVRFEIDLPENAFEKLQASQARIAALEDKLATLGHAAP